MAFSRPWVLGGFVCLVACRGGSPTAAPDGAREPGVVDASLLDASVADASVDSALDVRDASADVLDAGARADAADARAKTVVVPSHALNKDDDEGPPAVGKHGDVCQLGEQRHGAPGRVVSCGPGLQCCYPCGIQGCDWVCHTPSECEMDSRRP